MILYFATVSFFLRRTHRVKEAAVIFVSGSVFFNTLLFFIFNNGSIGFATGYFILPVYIFWLLDRKAAISYCAILLGSLLCAFFYSFFDVVAYSSGDILGIIVVFLILTIFSYASRQINDQREQSLRHALQSIAEEKAHDDALLAGMGEGIIATDQKGHIVMSNVLAEEMLGYTNSELKRKNILDVCVIQNENRQNLSVDQLPLHIALHTLRTIKSIYTLVRRDGSTLPVYITASPASLGNKPIGGVVLLRDISKDKEIDKIKMDFVTLASHQLRTPLAAIKWFTEMLIKGDFGPLQKDQQEIVTNISRSTERMIDLVNSLLNVTYFESGQKILDVKPTNLKNLIDEALLSLQQLIHEKKHSVVISVHPNLPIITVDPKLIRNVYFHLINNAILYTPAGGEISIFISHKHNEIISQITDNGAGIPKDEHKRVFEKFYRGSNIAKNTPDGSGLGLYIIRAIIESSGGKIWFESEEGKGTTWWFTLPIEKNIMPAKAEHTS
jgi:PAS domain S-box-containing protein